MLGQPIQALVLSAGVSGPGPGDHKASGFQASMTSLLPSSHPQKPPQVG